MKDLGTPRYCPGAFSSILQTPTATIARQRFDRVDGVPAPSDNLQLHRYTPPSTALQWLPRANEQCYRKSVSLSSADVKYRATHRASQPAISWKFPRTKLMLASPFQRLIPTALGRDREVLLTAHTQNNGSIRSSHLCPLCAHGGLCLSSQRLRNLQAAEQ